MVRYFRCHLLHFLISSLGSATVCCDLHSLKYFKAFHQVYWWEVPEMIQCWYIYSQLDVPAFVTGKCPYCNEFTSSRASCPFCASWWRSFCACRHHRIRLPGQRRSVQVPQPGSLGACGVPLRSSSDDTVRLSMHVRCRCSLMFPFLCVLIKHLYNISGVTINVCSMSTRTPGT